MRKIITLFMLASLLSGCTSQKKYAELENQQMETRDKLNIATEKLNQTLEVKEILENQLEEWQTQVLESPLGTDSFETASLPTELKLEDETEVPDSGLPSAYTSRKYLKNFPVEMYRDSINLITGTIVKYINETERLGNIGNRRFIKGVSNNFTIVPSSGVLKSHKFTEENLSKISWLVEVELKDKEIVELTVEDILRTMLNPENLDYTLLHQTYGSNPNINDYYIVRAATVTKITSRKFTESGRRINIANFPVGATALSFENSFYTSAEDLTTDHKVGLLLIPLRQVLEESQDFKPINN